MILSNHKIKIIKIVGSNIRSIRKKQNLTIENLAFKLGVEYTQLSRIERGTINTSLYQLFLISRVLNVSFSILFEGLDLVAMDLDDL